MTSYGYRNVLSAFLAVIALATYATVASAFPWDIDMYRGATVRPLTKAPRVMPDGTMPTTGGELPMTRSR